MNSNKKFDFSGLEELHKQTYDTIIGIVVDHYDTWVKDEKLKIKALTQIKKDAEQITNLLRGENEK